MTYTVSIIGAGIGAAHLAAYAELPDRFRVVSICDLDEERGRKVAARQPGVDFTSDFVQVLADSSIDIVDICLPPHLHFQACLDAIAANKKVICEKPLVASLEEADLLAARCAELDGFLSPVFQYRYGMGTAQLAALRAAGLAGRCYAGTLETHWDRPAAYYDVDWRGTWASERGGAILGHAIHIHDLLAHTVAPVERVYADLATRVNDIEVEDCAALSIRLRDGALLTSSVTLGSAENISRMRLMFEGFTVESDHAPYSLAEMPWRFVARRPTRQEQLNEVLETVKTPRLGYAGMFEAVADHLDGHGERHVTLEDGRRSLEFVTAVYHSARTGQPVELPLDPEHDLYRSWLPT